ncbi:probable ATP-dependent RNA helicase DDX31 isoform X2 [Acanthaster planci]|uniref:ATP-dependent RNA helicase n=1 Tax=Acanthaster planci TaxID=133434 RepID=A0A8B7ZRG6_ACAPL|nr:probable ATP-dependent RNA helicase DDX31 isoform X2 [Acanthaster planci]
MAEDDSEMMLNLVYPEKKTAEGEKVTSSQKCQEKESLKQETRSRAASRQSARLKHPAATSKTENDVGNFRPAQRTTKGQGAITDRPKVTGPPGHGKVISSLFRHNPEIPTVHVAKVQSGKEAVFSGRSFHDLPLHPHLISTLEKTLEFSHMTTVQQQAIPTILSGRDTLVKSQTGSGKTLAYAVPIINSLRDRDPKVQRSDGPYAIVLVPTRELALQSFNTLQKVLKPFQWIVPGYLMGGEKKKAEKARLRRGINILVATPGRLLDHLQHTETLKLERVQWLVMDEADRLLDMGYDRDVSLILNSLNEKCLQRQNILLSATLTEGVERLADVTLNEPVTIDIAKECLADQVLDQNPSAKSSLRTVETDSSQMRKGRNEGEVESVGDFTTPEGLQQHFVIVPSKLRLVTLAAFILRRAQTTGDCKMLVFLSSRDSVEFHYTLLKEGIKAIIETLNLLVLRLHGNMSQEERTQVFLKFQESKSGILLCTDVAARGLDLPKVKWIVQYNTPGSPEDYIHRVGRTARIGKKGQSLLFLTPAEVEYLSVLSQHKINMQGMGHDHLLQTLMTTDLLQAESQRHQPVRTAQEAAGALQRVFEEFVNSNKRHTVLAVKAFQSFVRAYATYPASLKHIFHVKKLHLGHTAKSFGLREAPSHITAGLGRQQLQASRGTKRKRKAEMKPLSAKQRILVEYGSGLGGGSRTVVGAKGPKASQSKTKQRRRLKGRRL